MRVIDGAHRLLAARLRGEERIRVRFFEGSEEEAFVWAVHANVAHGLPLSRADREAAAVRIMASHPQWSNRFVAAASGLSPSTVAAIRSRSTGQTGQLNARIGRDGKVRPLNSADARHRAGRIIAEQPDASLREVARRSGVSLGTVRDVRERLRRGEDPVPPKVRAQAGLPPGEPPAQPAARGGRTVSEAELALALHQLRRDPALRFSETGRALITWLGVQAMGPEALEEVLRAIPPHCAQTVLELALRCARNWQNLAELLAERERNLA